MSILCKLGIHKWIIYDYQEIDIGVELPLRRVCKRCKKDQEADIRNKNYPFQESPYFHGWKK